MNKSESIRELPEFRLMGTLLEHLKGGNTNGIDSVSRQCEDMGMKLVVAKKDEVAHA